VHLGFRTPGGDVESGVIVSNMNGGLLTYRWGPITRLHFTFEGAYPAGVIQPAIKVRLLRESNDIHFLWAGVRDPEKSKGENQRQ